MAYDLLRLSPRELVTLRMMARCNRLTEVARLLHREPKTISSQKSNIRGKLDIYTNEQWDALLAQVRGEPLDPAPILFTEIWSSYVGACSLLSRLQRLITDGEEAAIVEQAISDCANLSDGRLRVIRITNGVALEPAETRIDKSYVPMRTAYEDAP